MFGYATDETEEYMPFSFLMATKLANKITQVHKDKILTWLLPDGITEVTEEYEKKENSQVKLIRKENILISCQQVPDIQNDEIINKIKEKVINPITQIDKIDLNTKL